MPALWYAALLNLETVSDYYSQKRSLVPLKGERPWYKEVHSQVLQDMVKRVGKAFDRFIKGDKNGKRSGKPRFKGKNRYRTFAYPQTKSDWVEGNRVKLPKIGAVKFIQHRPLPEGFTLKTVILTLKADGWYVTFSLQDKSIPDQPVIDIKPTEANSIGVDAGLEYFIACSDGTLKTPPKFTVKQKTTSPSSRLSEMPELKVQSLAAS